MKLLVTGGVGFIGSEFCFQTIDNQVDYLLIVDKGTYAANPVTKKMIEEYASKQQRTPVKIVCEDILNTTTIRKLINDHGIDVIVNFAAESHVDRSIEGPLVFADSNYRGVASMLEATRTARHQVRLFLQISTDEVYGPRRGEINGRAREGDALKPTSPYAASKAAADLLCQAYARTYGLPVVISRSCNNYGPRQHLEKFIPKCIDRLSRGLKIPVYGDGDYYRQWIYVEENCQYLWKILESGSVIRYADEGIYNIGGEYRCNLDIIRELCLLMGKKYAEVIEWVPDRLAHDKSYEVNMDKLLTLGAVESSKSLTDNLQQTIDWYFANPDWV